MISVNDKKYLNKLKNCTVKPLEFQEQCLSNFSLFNFDSKTEKKNKKWKMKKKSTLQPIFPLQYMTIVVSVWSWSFKNEERLILGKSIIIFFLFLKLTLLPPKKYQRGCTNYGSLNSSVSKLPPYIFSRMHLPFWEDCDNHGAEFVIRELGEICYCSILFFKH